MRRARNSDGLLLVETFLLAAVVSFLVIRWFLAATGYPKVGGGGLHVAHMLWGGLLMLVALGLLLIFLDRSVQHAAAVVAGLGFGTFVDEIGKFLTSDNDYFFRPAVALIYVIFVAVFLIGRAAAGQRRLTEREALANALDLLEEHVGRPIEADDRGRIRALLDQAHGAPSPGAAGPNPTGTADPINTDTANVSASPGADSDVLTLARAVRRYLDDLPEAADPNARLEAFPSRLVAAYVRLTGNAWFDRALVIGVVAYAGAAVVGVLALALSAPPTGRAETWTVSQLGEAISTLVGAALVLRGVADLPNSREAAYHWLMRGLLVWVLVTQVFVFYTSQLAGIGGLAIDLAAYVSLRFAMAREGVVRSDAERPGSGVGRGS